PELKKVTVTEVEMPPDLRLARVFFSVLGGEADRERAA
ncbi:MAG: ribosome-binding factor A, partial [Thermoanaerobaculia bacterium]|nr:ribosome-binding factor A [Thermoanaerobaculia bacterium]